MLFQLTQRDLLIQRDIVTHDVQIAFLKVNNLIALRIFKVGISNVPLFRHRPVEDFRPAGNLVESERYVLLEQAKTDSDSISCNAPTNRVQLGDKIIYLLADKFSAWHMLNFGGTHVRRTPF